jgi:hypothetical protein
LGVRVSLPAPNFKISNKKGLIDHQSFFYLQLNFFTVGF